jgi:NADPH:quinone reductase-like Zn-dependent oxidoreductase
MDAAGTVDEVGDGAPWCVGDQVMAIVLPTGPHGGAYASQVVVPADSVARIPSGSTFVEASTLPMKD